MDRRFAIYAAPPRGSALAEWGVAWLGRDAETGALLPQPALPGWTAADIARVTEFPRRYGLHATLKPPFRLAEGKTEEALSETLARFAEGRAPPLRVQLRLTSLGGFLALVPQGDAAPLCRLADDCVERFDRFRAPPSAEELARRRQARLSPREETHLERWGYPYVFDTFRFHITLSGSLPEEERRRLAEALAPFLAPVLAAPLAILDLALFVSEADGSFRLARRFPLRASDH
jgi:putative phosphonate metabolism protein